MRGLLYVTVYSLSLIMQTDPHFDRGLVGLAILVATILLQLGDKTERAK